MVWNEKVVIKISIVFFFLDSESEDEETKNKQLMTSKLAKTLDELCTKVRMSHLFSPRNRKLSLFTNKKRTALNYINYFIIHISFL